jgi:hypothetical protein
MKAQHYRNARNNERERERELMQLPRVLLTRGETPEEKKETL